MVVGGFERVKGIHSVYMYIRTSTLRRAFTTSAHGCCTGLPLSLLRHMISVGNTLSHRHTQKTTPHYDHGIE